MRKVKEGETTWRRGIAPGLYDAATSIRTLDRSTCKPPKCYFGTEGDVIGWILEPLSPNDRAEFQAFDPVPNKHGKAQHNKARHKSFDCSIMDRGLRITREEALAM